MKTAVQSPKLARLVRGIGNAVVSRFTGKWTLEQYVDALVEELKKENLNHPSFCADIARHFARADVANRANVDPFTVDQDTGLLMPHLFDARRFDKGVIRLGNRLNIRMSEATAQEWIVRQYHQQQAAEAAQRHASRTSLFLQSEPGHLLMENPRMQTAEAMYQLNFWPNDDVVADAPDDVEDEDMR